MARSYSNSFLFSLLCSSLTLVLSLSFQPLSANSEEHGSAVQAADSGMLHQHTTTVGESSMAQAEHHVEADHAQETHAFDPGHMITEHISDAHDWHLWGHTHVPLPVILYTNKGLEIFSSANFRSHGEHGLNDYSGKHYTYRLEDEEVVILNAEGSIDEVATSSILDVSITKNVLTMFIVFGLMLFLFISVAGAYKKRQGQAPKGLQSFIEPIIIFVRDDLAKPSIGKKYEKFMPYLLTVFFFIWIANLLGLIPVLPGGANMTGNIAITLTLAIFSFIITTINGNKHYWGHIFAMPGVPTWVLFLLTPIEILGVFLRPFVLMIRLFANITAGHIIALAFFSLIFIFGKGGESVGAGVGVGVASWLFTVFMMFLELLVAFLQAYVFTLLSAIYFGSAVEEAHHHDEHELEHAH
jgi:F-type H+-transporting ATPase subunit a